MKRFLGIMVVLCMTLGTVPTGVWAQQKEASSFTELRDALNAVGDATIVVTQDIELEESIVVNLGNKILTSNGDYTISRKEGYTGFWFDMFYQGGITLQFGEDENPNKLIFDGKNINTTASVISVSAGTLTVKNSVFKDLVGPGEGAAIFVGDGGTVISDNGVFENCVASTAGGAVCIRGGSFTMNGGSIKNCTATPFAGCWAAIHILDAGTATIKGGSITDCINDAIWVESQSVLNLLGGNFANCRYYVYSGGPAGELNMLQSVYDQIPPEKYYVDVGGGWALTILPDGPAEDTVVLDFDGASAVIHANYDFGNAVLIFASYNAQNNLIDIYTAAVSYTEDNGKEIRVKDGFKTDSQGTVKVMLWDSLDICRPLANAKNAE